VTDIAAHQIDLALIQVRGTIQALTAAVERADGTLLKLFKHEKGLYETLLVHLEKAKDDIEHNLTDIMNKATLHSRIQREGDTVVYRVFRDELCNDTLEQVELTQDTLNSRWSIVE